MANKIAAVTGSNKGIGYVTVRELCKRGVGTVYLCSRDVGRGKAAVENLKKEGFNPEFHQLDITDKNSVKAFAAHLKDKHGGLDILINNAAAITTEFIKTTYNDAIKVIDTNYNSAFIIQEYLYPVLKDNARVINMSSDCGHISNLKNKYWIERLTKEEVKVEDVNAFVDWFLDSVKNETLKMEDFKEPVILAYRISKVALSALTRIQQRQIGRGISINSLHPGFVQTDMTKTVVPAYLVDLIKQNPKLTEHLGRVPLEKSGEAPAFLALDVDQSAKGRYFWYDKTEKDWADPNLDVLAKSEDFIEVMKNSGTQIPNLQTI